MYKTDGGENIDSLFNSHDDPLKGVHHFLSHQQEEIKTRRGEEAVPAMSRERCSQIRSILIPLQTPGFTTGLAASSPRQAPQD